MRIKFIWNKLPKNKIALLWLGIAFLEALMIAYLAYQINLMQTSDIRIYSELRNLNIGQESTTKRLGDTITVLDKNLSLTKSEQSKLKTALDTEKAKVKEQEKQLANISGTVGTLEKLTYTDKELLQKYSKVYFLNEHFVPINLSKIDNPFVEQSKKDLLIHSSMLPYLKNLMNAAGEDGQSIRVISAYRSFDSQSSLKSTYNVIYGEGAANQFSADQGYSEHQLGTTIDFTTKQLGTNFNSFAETKGYEWLLTNGHKYGFVMSYPPDNKFYQFEPWHWRFVGVKLATDLKNQNKFFYDLEQRKIDEYLVNVFD